MPRAVASRKDQKAAEHRRNLNGVVGQIGRSQKPQASAGRAPFHGKNFADLLRDLQSPALRGLIEDRFGIDLSGCDGVTTVRGWCGARDGNVHTDIARKAVTLLLYLND